jgi:MOSC domain-containing protein YiiM
MKFRKLKEEARVVAVLRTFGKKGFETQRVEKAGVTLAGIPGDRHSGFHKSAGVREQQFYKKGTPVANHRQWSAVSQEELEVIAKAMEVKAVRPEHLGANFVFEGIPDFTLLPPLTRIRIGKEPYVATLVVYEENAPCKHPQEAMERGGINVKGEPFVKAAKHRRGLVGWVEKGARVKGGDPVEVWVPDFYPYNRLPR